MAPGLWQYSAPLYLSVYRFWDPFRFLFTFWIIQYTLFNHNTLFYWSHYSFDLLQHIILVPEESRTVCLWAFLFICLIWLSDVSVFPLLFPMRPQQTGEVSLFFSLSASILRFLSLSPQITPLSTLSLILQTLLLTHSLTCPIPHLHSTPPLSHISILMSDPLCHSSIVSFFSALTASFLSSLTPLTYPLSHYVTSPFMHICEYY